MKRYYFLYFLLIIYASNAQAAEREAIFAGGCFWCMEEAFEKLDGVLVVESGFTGGHRPNPSYRQVVGGNTGHYEAVRVLYEDTKIDYNQLLRAFWQNIDPLDDGGQFCDRGSSYKTAIFYLDDEQKKLARESFAWAAARLDGSIVTPLLPATQFYPAEDYHQDYHRMNPLRYTYYKYSCGRPQRLKELWGKS